MVTIKNGMSQKELSNMQKEIDKVDGVEWCLGMNSVIGSSIPSDMIPSSMKEMLQSDEYEMQFICSNYKSATEKVNKHQRDQQHCEEIQSRFYGHWRSTIDE